jgi:hypothetical protein
MYFQRLLRSMKRGISALKKLGVTGNNLSHSVSKGSLENGLSALLLGDNLVAKDTLSRVPKVKYGKNRTSDAERILSLIGRNARELAEKGNPLSKEEAIDLLILARSLKSEMIRLSVF